MHKASMAVVCRPSVCPVPDPKSRMERHRQVTIIDTKEAHDTCDPSPHLEVER